MVRGPGTLQAGGAQYLPGHRQTFKTETRPQNRMRLQAQRGLFSRTKSSPARAASSNADETTEPGAAAAAGKVRTRVHQEGDYKEDIDRNTQRGRASLSTPGLASAMAKSAISSEEFSRTRSSPSSATSSKSLETSQHGGSLSGAQHILSRRAAFAEPAAYSAAAAAGNVRMRLDKEGALHPSATKFHGGFLDGNIFGRNSSILESRFRWRTAASSTISHFHSIPSESFGLDTPEMQRKLAELERSLADDDADAVNTQGLRDSLREVLLGGALSKSGLVKGTTSQILAEAGARIVRTPSSKYVDIDPDRAALEAFDATCNRPPRTPQANARPASWDGAPAVATSFGATTNTLTMAARARRASHDEAPLHIVHQARQLPAFSDLTLRAGRAVGAVAVGSLPQTPGYTPISAGRPRCASSLQAPSRSLSPASTNFLRPPRSSAALWARSLGGSLSQPKNRLPVHNSSAQSFHGRARPPAMAGLDQS